MAKKLLKRSEMDGLLGKKLKRALPLSRAEMKIDEEARTVEMSFSSDEPIEHWFGKLILNHAPAAIRLGRLRDGGPLLLDHDSTKQIGVHEEVHTDGHKMRGTVRFSKGPLGEEIFTDVKDKIRRNASVGLILHELHLVREDEDGPVYQTDDWEPLENSIVAIPRDTSVGVGRSMEEDDDEARAQDEAEQRGDGCECDGAGCEKCNPPADGERGNDSDSGAGAERAAETTQPRSKTVEENEKEIIELGVMFGEEDLARDMALDGKTKEEVRAAIKAKRAAAQKTTQPPVEDPAATAARNGGGEQLARVSSRVNLRSFRGDNAAQVAHRAGHFLNAALFRNEQSLQFCRENGISVKRAHSESDNESGGFLVPTEFENVMIDLRNEYGVFRRNANVVPMSAGRKERPRRKGGLKAYPIGARGASRRLTESKKGWDLVGLDPKKWGVLAKYEEELSDDAVISMADDFASEAAYAFTQVEDECGFLGDGTSDYHGIVGLITRLRNPNNAAALPAVANVASLIEASGNLWSEIELIDILGLVGRLPNFARRSGQVKWYCSNEFWATVLCRIALTLGGTAIAQVQDEINPVFLGKPVEFVEVMPHVEANSQIPLAYGNVAQAAMLGDRKGMTVKMTDSNDTDFEEDLMAVKATERFDVNVHDVGNASATASERKAGPVVALITKSS